jgi:hypothetical protein
LSTAGLFFFKESDIVTEVTFGCSIQQSEAILTPAEEETMATTLALAIDSGGVVINILQQNAIHLPVLFDSCTATDVAESIPAFQAATLSKEKRKKLIKHAMHCRPCRRELGWGDL